MTFVNYAEWVWNHAKEKENNPGGYTQEEMAKILGWNRVRIAQYKALQDITFKAWEIIVTSFNNHVTQQENNHVTENVTNVTFSEGLLRGPFLTLKPRRQYELVFRLADPKGLLPGIRIEDKIKVVLQP